MSNPKKIIERSDLIIGDRVSFPFIIGTAIIEYIRNKNRPDLEFSRQRNQESAQTVSKLIVRELQDEIYLKDVKNSYTIKYYDKRAYWCGFKVGPRTKENQFPFKDLDPDSLVQAVMGLLFRKKMLAKSIHQELMDQLGTDEE